MEKKLFAELQRYVDALDYRNIAQSRRGVLEPLAAFIQSKISQGSDLRLNMICTHNSRRSHLAQVWAQAAAEYFGIPKVHCYSGGTEATAMYPMIAKTLSAAGFRITALSEGTNPVYAVKFGPDAHPVICFSKKYDDAFNPEAGCAAIMTCSQADNGCPVIPGADLRLAIPYDDPKAFDHSPQESEGYASRSRQIAIEMFYVFSLIKSYHASQ